MLFTTTSKLYAKRRKRAKPKLLQNMVAYNSLFKQATRSLFIYVLFQDFPRWSPRRDSAINNQKATHHDS